MGLQVGAEPPGGEAERAGARPRDRQGRGPPHQRRAAASQAGAYVHACTSTASYDERCYEYTSTNRAPEFH